MLLYIYSPKECLLISDKECFALNQSQPYLLETESGFCEFDFGSDYELSRYNAASDTKKYVTAHTVYGEKLIIPSPKRSRSKPYKLHYSENLSERKDGAVISAYSDGGEFLKLETDFGVKIVELPFTPENVKTKIINGNILFVAAKAQNGCTLAAFTANAELQFFQTVDDFELATELKTITRLTNGFGFTLTDVWKIGVPFTSVSRLITSAVAPTEKLIPYAFLEEVRLNGKYEKYLAPKLKENAKLIPEFLGSFSIALPPISAAFKNTITLIGEGNVKYLKCCLDENAPHLITELTVENSPF